MQTVEILVPRTPKELQDTYFNGNISIISLSRINILSSFEISKLVENRKNIILCDVKPKMLSILEILRG